MFKGMNEAILSAFVEPFTYKAAGGDLLLQGVFDDQVQQRDLGGVGFTDRLYTLSLDSAVVIAQGIALQESVVVRGVYYQVVDIHADVTGLATLMLRKY